MSHTPDMPEGMSLEYRPSTALRPSLWGVHANVTKAGWWWRQDGRFRSECDAAGAWPTEEEAAHKAIQAATNDRLTRG